MKFKVQISCEIEIPDEPHETEKERKQFQRLQAAEIQEQLHERLDILNPQIKVRPISGKNN